MTEPNNCHDATEQMFANVGAAITRWTFVEEALSSIFSICTSATVCVGRGIEFLDSQTSMTVFYSAESFRTKLALVNAALSVRFLEMGASSSDLKSQWMKLQERTRKLSLRRNKLAHWTVLPAFTVEADELYPARLVPPFGSPGYYRETGLRPTKNTLKPLHVEHLDRAFYLISQKLREFAQSLAAREELFDRSVRLLARQIRSLDRKEPRRAERLRLAVSSLEEHEG